MIKEIILKVATIESQRQAEIMRKKIPEYAKDFKSSIPEIEVSGSLNYRHGHVYHLEYDSNSLPAEEVLEKIDKEKITFASVFLNQPVCAVIGERVSIQRIINKKFRLIGVGIIESGETLEVLDS